MRKTHAGYWFSILLFYIYFFTLSLLAVSMLDSLDRYNPLTYTLIIAASFFILSTIQTAIHEAGHLLFGLLSGWRFGSFRLYSWIWLRENGKLRVKRSKIVGTAGQCLLIPPETEDGKMPYTLYNMGGVLLNLILAALLGALGFALKDSAVASFIAFVLAVQGLYSALLNGIPMRYAMVSNDGSNQRQMCKSPAARRSFRIQMQIMAQLAAGVRLRDMPEEWFVIPSDTEMQSNLTASLAALACERLIDAHQFADAAALAKHLAEGNASLVGLAECQVACDRATAELLEGICDGVPGYLNTRQMRQYMKAMRQSLTVLRTQYICARLGEKNSKRAEAIRIQFESRAKKHPYPVEADAERELLSLADERAENT